MPSVEARQKQSECKTEMIPCMTDRQTDDIVCCYLVWQTDRQTDDIVCCYLDAGFSLDISVTSWTWSWQWRRAFWRWVWAGLSDTDADGQLSDDINECEVNQRHSAATDLSLNHYWPCTRLVSLRCTDQLRRRDILQCRQDIRPTDEQSDHIILVTTEVWTTNCQSSTTFSRAFLWWYTSHLIHTCNIWSVADRNMP